MPTVDPADIRGLATTLLFTVKRLPHSRHEGRPEPPLNALEGCAKPGPHLCPIRGIERTTSNVDRHLLGDDPREGNELACHGGDGDVRVFATGRQAPEALAQAQLSFPADVLNGF